MSGGYSPVRKLLATDQVDAFDCGQAALNQFLQRYALVNQKANSAQTYVCCQGDVVVGFYQNAPQCSACNRAAVQGVVKRRYRPQGDHSGLSCCSMYCLSTDKGAPPTVKMQ